MFAPERFILAQKDQYRQAIGELRIGRKETHWMWFIFPQLKELGRSRTANYFGLDDLDAARIYLEHTLLGPRLIEASTVLLVKSSRSISTILEQTDSLKLRSCATLFAMAGDEPVFSTLLSAFYDGQPCQQTLNILQYSQNHRISKF
jgi:uncharacterized protein (DUF1810 family)